jgi:hypothetical protein
VIKINGTEQLRYFMDEGADYIHSMAFASVMVNWISPGGLFIGMRRIIFTVQPDDLFLGSYVWNTTTHSNPVGTDAFFYRITADDLQNLAEYVPFPTFFEIILTIFLQFLRPCQPPASKWIICDR